MNDRRLLKEIKRIVLDHCSNELVSLFAIGSFLSHEMVESSDIDLIGVMKSSFDFKNEAFINRELNERIHSIHRIDLGTVSYDELLGGAHKGSLTKHIELSILLNFLKRARLIHGKRIKFDKLPIVPASPLEELRYHVKVFDEYNSDFKRKERIGPDFAFSDIIKIIFYIANLELQLRRNLTPRWSYSEVVRAFRRDKNHIVHYSMKLRRKKAISHAERESWLDLAEGYVSKMKTELVNE